jgi:hypothetical protein
MTQKSLRTIGVDFFGPAKENTNLFRITSKDTILNTHHEKIRRMLSRIRAKESILEVRLCESKQKFLLEEKVIVQDRKG